MIKQGIAERKKEYQRLAIEALTILEVVEEALESEKAANGVIEANLQRVSSGREYSVPVLPVEPKTLPEEGSVF
ncbi:MAG: hypothetical protein L0Y80_11025 [Ignavibacteriae bacterium]|nr:hypothetical protein [Ignavibacteriota bacterium]